MNRQAFRLLTVYLLLVSYVATGASTCLGMVLCTDPDGRVALEASDGQGRCAECEFLAQRSEATGLSAIAAHVPCVDTPLLGATDAKGHQASPEAPFPPPILLLRGRILTDVSASEPSPATALTPLELPAHYRDSSSRRSIVLLV